MVFTSCKKTSESTPVTRQRFYWYLLQSMEDVGSSNFVNNNPVIKFSFSSKVDRLTANNKATIASVSGFLSNSAYL
jgi:hypothetical protein